MNEFCWHSRRRGDRLSIVIVNAYVQIAFCWLYAAAAAAATEAGSSSFDCFTWQLSCEDGGAKDFKALIFLEDAEGVGVMTWEGWLCGGGLSSENSLANTQQKRNKTAF